MTLRGWLICCALLVPAAAWARSASAPPARRPNVLFIIADDLRAATDGFGDTAAKTPNLDRLAREGLRFTRAYAQYPVCNPSRVSMLTGLRPETAGVLSNSVFFRDVLPDVVTLPQLFKQNGYFTASFGKVFHRGPTMEDIRSDWADGKSWSHIRIYQATDTGNRGEGRRMAGAEAPWCRWLAADGADEDQPDGMIAAEAVRLLRESRAAPFFLAVGFHKPHDPFIAPKKYFDQYPLDAMPVAVDPPDRSPDLPLAIPNAYGRFASFTDRERREFKRAYLAGTSFMDAQVGKLLDVLDERKLWDNTIVVFLGDHGYHLGERGWWNKDTLFELSAHAPLLVHAPGMRAAGQRSASLVEFVDLYPTLVDLAGLQAPHRLEGVTLRPLFDRPARQVKDAAFTVVARNGGKNIGRTVRTDRWRYTEWDQGRSGVELYDHRVDPGEYHNVAARPGLSGEIAKLKRMLASGGRKSR